MTTFSARRMVTLTCTAAAALVLSACASEQPAGSSGAAVSTRNVDGVGTVLVDNAGKTLYFTDSDQAGNIRCTADCLTQWQPAMSSTDTPDGGSVSGVSVVRRPEGTSQLAYQNKPLYTFTLDSADKPVTGDNATDSFGGIDFTWHAVLLTANPAPPQDNGGGYGGGGGY